MSLYILSAESTRESAIKLAARLEARHVESACEVPSAHQPKVIRWGTSDLCHMARDFDGAINQAIKIKENTNKLSAISKLGVSVSVPTIYRRKVPAGVKAVIRPLEHARGAGFELRDGPIMVPEGHYAKEFIPNAIEYRVWFAGEDMICGKRVPIASQGQTPEDPCRSLWGYAFRDATENQRRLVSVARHTLGLHFGAADILWSEEDSCYYVLELNTAPSLDHSTVLEFFARTIPTLEDEE